LSSKAAIGEMMSKDERESLYAELRTLGFADVTQFLGR
jgi:hypothetical protein